MKLAHTACRHRRRAWTPRTDALVAMGHIVLTDEGGEVTSSGGHFLSAFGADLRPRTRRIFCQPCLDWSERRYHLKGLVGARILDRLLELVWRLAVVAARVRLHDARVHRKPLALDQAGRHAGSNNTLEDVAKDITLSESVEPVL